MTKHNPCQKISVKQEKKIWTYMMWKQKEHFHYKTSKRWIIITWLHETFRFFFVVCFSKNIMCVNWYKWGNVCWFEYHQVGKIIWVIVKIIIIIIINRSIPKCMSLFKWNFIFGSHLSTFTGKTNKGSE